MRRTAVQEEENDTFGPRRKVRKARGARGKNHLRSKQSGQSHHAKPGAHAVQHLAAGKEWAGCRNHLRLVELREDGSSVAARRSPRSDGPGWIRFIQGINRHITSR